MCEKKNNDEKDLTIIKEIYQEIYCKFKEQYIVVFLCGGASSTRYKSLRDRVRKLLENNVKPNFYKTYKVFYPEDLLIEVLNKTKDADLLSYEQFLANNSHVLVIICESAGSLVELGAFTNNKYTVDKVIAAVDKRHIRDKSFIMLGPIKLLKKRNKINVLSYGQNEQEFVKKLSSVINEKYKLNYQENNMINLTTIVGMHYFIQLLLYFFRSLNSNELANKIKQILEEYCINIDDFNVLFSAALKLLFQDKKIIKMTSDQYSLYKLTNYGFESIQSMIVRCTKTGLCDRIRFELMYNELY